MADAQTVINQIGPLPISASFNALSDGPALIMVSGSVWANTNNVPIGIRLSIDGAPVRDAWIFANPGQTHMAVVPLTVPYEFSFGSHKITLSPMNGNTVGDQNDFYQVTILY